jgi:hypothetical protein
VGGVKFSPGSVVATPGVLEAFRTSGEDPLPYLVRHICRRLAISAVWKTLKCSSLPQLIGGRDVVRCAVAHW